VAPASLGGQQASAAATPTAAPTDSPSPSDTGDDDTSAASTALGKKAMAKYGIPCVY
jgi:hypothetical protein